MSLSRIILKKNEEKRILSGHLWVFSNEVEHYEGDIINGGIVDVHTHNQVFLGRALYNRNSLICGRIISRTQEELDKGFFCRRFREAYNFRLGFYPQEDSFRVVYGESDFLPGLVVDKFADYLVLQILSLGMENLLPLIIEALDEVFSPKGIYLRNDVDVRMLEGLPLEKRVAAGEAPLQNIIITHNGLRYTVDVINGQKTGFFFDQRENRRTLGQYCLNKTVLDCFCYNGGFSLSAGQGGALKVMGVDTSTEAVALSRENAALNSLAEKCEFVQGDVFDFLAGDVLKEKYYDVINVDPPSFTKTKKNVPQALKGYRKLNSLAMSAVKRGGIVFSSSCSHYIDEAAFLAMLKDSAVRAKRTVRLLEFRGQAKDHPVLLAMPETKYLKCAIMEIL